MIRLGKLTDYGVGLMTRMAQDGAAGLTNARDLSGRTGMPLPTVSKILKLLCQAGLLESRRGVGGGYALARDPRQITLGDMVDALEGPVALTECVGDGDCNCAYLADCGLQQQWNGINRRLQETLNSVTLAEMAAEAACPSPQGKGA